MAIRVGSKGRIVLPREAREALGVDEDDELIAVVRANEVALMTKDEAERQLQDAFAGGPDLVDELIAERHAAARADAEEEARWRAKGTR